jgi:hypothetical protein
VNFRGPANVVFEGHELRDVISSESRPAFWFVFDPMARAGRAAGDRPPDNTMTLIRQYLERENAYV